MSACPSPSTALVHYLGTGNDGATAWLRMPRSDRRRIAMRAAREKDAGTLWSLTEAWLRTFSKAGATVAALLRAATDPHDRALVLLGAHAGLRARECVDLRWADISLARRDLVVRRGKGNKARTVAMSASLKQALVALPQRSDGHVLPYRTPVSAWRHMQALCEAAHVAAKGVHALRHSAGTRLYAETQDLETTARHLGHATLETTRVYAKWSDRRLRETIGRW